MTTISKHMLAILERLAEMFPTQNYQTRLESYLSDKGITDVGQLEYHIKQFDMKSGSSVL